MIVIQPSCTFYKPNKINFLPSNRVLDRKPDRITGYKVLIDLTSRLCICNTWSSKRPNFGSDCSQKTTWIWTPCLASGSRSNRSFNNAIGKNIVSVFDGIQRSLNNFELSATIMTNSSPDHNTSEFVLLAIKKLHGVVGIWPTCIWYIIA
jgi:hypothetical protein